MSLEASKLPGSTPRQSHSQSGSPDGQPGLNPSEFSPTIGSNRQELVKIECVAPKPVLWSAIATQCPSARWLSQIAAIWLYRFPSVSAALWAYLTDSVPTGR